MVKKKVKPKKRVIKSKNSEPEFKITKAQAVKVLKVVDAGLVSGIGNPTPGQMCVEAAVAYAFGEDHNDHPKCVLRGIAETKISINDWDGWDDLVLGKDRDTEVIRTKKVNKLRAKTLRRLAIAQLGSKGVISTPDWEKAVSTYLTVPDEPRKAETRATLVQALANLDAGEHVYVDIDYYPTTKELLDGVENLKDMQKLCEGLVQILVKLKSPGTKFLYLTK